MMNGGQVWIRTVLSTIQIFRLLLVLGGDRLEKYPDKNWAMIEVFSVQKRISIHKIPVLHRTNRIVQNVDNWCWQMISEKFTR